MRRLIWVIVLIGFLIIAFVIPEAPDYPKDWPSPDTGPFASAKGNCPNLTGDYDQMDGRLSWLLDANPDIEKSVPHWQEHRAVITQAEDGSWLRIAFSLNEKGLAEYRERLLKFNQEANGGQIHRDVWLEEGKHYVCRLGWLRSARYAQPERVKGSKRKSLQVARDNDGALIAGATISFSHSLFAWADFSSDASINLDKTRWYRWPLRDPENDKTLQGMQEVTLHRYDWVNPGNLVPLRFTSFYLEPICVRFNYSGYPVKVSGPIVRREKDDLRPAEEQCPENWGRFDVGEVFRKQLSFPDDDRRPSFIEWYRMNAPKEKPRIILIEDVRDLPLMPKKG